MAKELEQLHYLLCLFLFLYLYLYLAPLMEVIRPPSEPDQQEDENRVLVLVQKQEQVEVQVKAQQRPVFLDIELVIKQHTAVPNVQANDCKQEEEEEEEEEVQWQGA